MRRLSWLLGAALLLAVVLASLSLSEGREFARLVERSDLRWFALAVALQAGTYLAQAEVFRGAPRRAGILLPRFWLYQLSLTKLFLDQALPSAGLSSVAVVASALQRRGVPRGAVAAGAVINIASYHMAYVLALLVALAITVVLGETNMLIVLVSASFLAFAIGLTVLVILLSGRPARSTGPLARIPILQRATNFLQAADARLARDSRLLAEATGWQVLVLLLDAATMWVLIRSVGSLAPADAVFASFMISSLFRTMGVVPGGLGTYEATSVLTLRLIGVSVPVALSATLIFRGLSFWAPMLPGLWFSRRLTAGPDQPPG